MIGSLRCWLFGVALILAACAAKHREPELPTYEKFTASGEALLPEKWWESFNDPDLNRLVDRALADNLDLLAAWDRLDQAQAYARMAGAPLWPEITAGFGVTDREIIGEEDPALGGETRTTIYSASLMASYELDLWGRVRAQRSAARAELEATSEDLLALAVTISSEVSRVWFELIETRGQLEVLAEQVKVNEAYLELILLRFSQGLSPAAEALQQKQQLEAVRSDIPLMEMRRELLEHELAALLARTPDFQLETAAARLPELPPLPETGLPADLLMRRPDVRAALKRYEASGHRVDQAFANRLPTISITLSASDAEQEIASLFDNWTRNLAVNLLAPLFDAGRRKADEERARAAANESLRRLQKVYLTALREVEDALARERRQTEHIKALELRLESSKHALNLSRERYRNGAIDYLPVLINLQTVQGLERALIQARRLLIIHRINLHRALAGGWEIERQE